MTDEAIAEEIETPATAKDVWESVQARLGNSDPITKEDVKGDRPESDATPDRVLVAPELAKFLQGTVEPEVSPTEERLARIEAALTPAAEPVALDVAQEVAALRQQLADKEAEEVARAQTEAYEAQLRTFKDGVLANLRADADKYPGVLAAGFEDNVLATLVSELEAGESVSEDTIASKAETDMKALYETLKAVYETSATSEEPASSEDIPTPTLTPSLSASDSPVDVESMVDSGADRRAISKAIWEKTHR